MNFSEEIEEKEASLEEKNILNLTYSDLEEEDHATSEKEANLAEDQAPTYYEDFSSLTPKDD